MTKSTDDIFQILFKEDEITWQSLIYELVRTEQMDAWDVDISLLSQKYIELLKKLQEFDFRISGKVVLAAAILLNIKTTKLLEEDFTTHDNMISPPAPLDDDAFYKQVDYEKLPADRLTLIPRTPQPRKRKVSVFDLVEALQKALEVQRRRVLREVDDVVEMPVIEKKTDITKIIQALFEKINAHFNGNGKLLFHELVGSDKKEDKIATFVPLLHLSNQRKVDMLQEKTFGDIEITLARKDETGK